jgi:hypothetical protein
MSTRIFFEWWQSITCLLFPAESTMKNSVLSGYLSQGHLLLASKPFLIFLLNVAAMIILIECSKLTRNSYRNNSSQDLHDGLALMLGACMHYTGWIIHVVSVQHDPRLEMVVVKAWTTDVLPEGTGDHTSKRDPMMPVTFAADKKVSGLRSFAIINTFFYDETISTFAVSTLCHRFEPNSDGQWAQILPWMSDLLTHSFSQAYTPIISNLLTVEHRL